jgi:hypothetical protein
MELMGEEGLLKKGFDPAAAAASLKRYQQYWCCQNYPRHMKPFPSHFDCIAFYEIVIHTFEFSDLVRRRRHQSNNEEIREGIESKDKMLRRKREGESGATGVK